MTKAQFIRDCKENKISLKMVYRFGEKIPGYMQGAREISKINTVSIFLVNPSGIESELELRPASLMDYDGKFLTLYKPIERDLTPSERKIFEDVRKQTEIYSEKNPYGNYSRFMERLFDSSPFPWLSGYEKIGGFLFLPHIEKVWDYHKKGQMFLKYEIIKK